MKKPYSNRKLYFIFIAMFLIIAGCIIVYKKNKIDFIKVILNKYYPSYSNKDNKPELNLCFVNHWPGVTIDRYKIITEVFESLGYFIKESKNNNECDIAIDSVFGDEKIVNKNAFKIFFTGEAQDPKIEGYDLSLGFSYLSHQNYLRLPLYYSYYSDKISDKYSRGKCDPNKEYFACFLVSNGSFKVRNDTFHKISLYKEVKSGGPYLNNMGRIIPREQTNEFLSKCKFVIAYENNFSYPGYITEKVFQAYFAGSMPIYASHPSAAEDINKEAIIYAPNFKSDEEMIDYIKELDQDGVKYCDKWHNKIITNPERNYEFMKEQIRKKIEAKVREKFTAVLR